MRHKNIAKLDSKGRMLIPSHVRKLLKVKGGTEVIIVPDHENNHARILPLHKDRTAEIRITLGDDPASLADVADVMKKLSMDILMSQTRSIIKGKKAEWSLLVDTSQCNNGFDKIRTKFLGLENVKKVEIQRV